MASKSFKNSSVKKLMLLAVVPQVPENHPNMEVILGELNMESVEFSVSADVKMCKSPQPNITFLTQFGKFSFLVNCLVGKASGQPKYGCPFCNTGSPYSLEDYELYTLGDLEDWHEVCCYILEYIQIILYS